MPRKKTDKSIVIDTGTFVRAVIYFDRFNIDEHAMAYSAMIERRHILLLSNRVRNQYKTIARIIFNLPPKFIDRKIAELKNIYHHPIKNIGKEEIEREKMTSDRITNLQPNDRIFVELACNRADFLISPESKIGEGLNKRFTEFRKICRFEIRLPIEYVEMDD